MGRGRCDAVKCRRAECKGFQRQEVEEPKREDRFPRLSTINQQWTGFRVAHLLFDQNSTLGKLYARSVRGGLLRSTRPGNTILTGDIAVSVNCTGDIPLFFDKGSPPPDEKYFIICDREKIEVEFFGCVDAVIHRAKDEAVTVDIVEFVPRVPVGLRSFNVIQEEHDNTLGDTGGQILDGRGCFRNKMFGN